MALYVSCCFSLSGGFTSKGGDGYVVIDANKEISDWIETHPIHMWKHGELKNYTGFYDRYIISEQLLMWLKLRWSA